MRFICIDDGVPEITVRLLSEASTARGVEFLHLDAKSFPVGEDTGLEAGAMMYRPATSAAAARLEQVLWHDRIATFHADPLGPFFLALSYPLVFQNAELPIPRTLPIGTADPDRLACALAAVGGPPAVVKVLGYEGGAGVVRVDSLPGLISTADLLLTQGQQPYLCAFIEEAVHWRAVVVAERVVAAYRNPIRPGDFRSRASEDPADVTTSPRPAIADLAVRAVKALRLEFGGVDILEHPSGRLYLLEANFPCYFAHAQEIAGVDVAGAMVEHLIGRSRSLR